MAIIAMNSDSEASAAASWIIALSIKSTVSMIASNGTHPVPVRSRIKLIWKARGSRRCFRKSPPLTALFQDFFTTPLPSRALAFPQGTECRFLCWPYDGEFNQRSSVMSRAEQYRHLATDVRSRASRESNPMLKAEWENLVETYVQLAEQSEWDTDLTYDPIQDMLDRTRH
jgi:hypothetical protein